MYEQCDAFSFVFAFIIINHFFEKSKYFYLFFRLLLYNVKNAFVTTIVKLLFSKGYLTLFYIFFRQKVFLLWNFTIDFFRRLLYNIYA